MDTASLREACTGADAVVHLVAIIRGSPEDFERVHVQGTRNVIQAAQEAGVKRFLHMSANGVDSDLHTPYFDTKREMERLVKAAGFDWTIFRPSYIAGSGKGGFDSQFAAIVDSAPILPSFGGGKFEIQPISRRDVGIAFARALTTPASLGKTYTLVGPERMTWNDYLRRLSKLRQRKRALAYVPAGVVIAAARILGPLMPADADQIRMLVLGNIGDPSDSVKDLGLDLETWEHAVAGLKR